MVNAPLKWDSRGEALEKWGAQVSTAVVHTTANARLRGLSQNIKRTTLLLVVSVAAAYVLIRCYRRLTVVNSLAKGPLRSLAEGEETRGAASCVGADLGSKPSPAFASAGIEPVILQRVEGVTQRLIQVAKDCSAVAVLLPPPFTMRLADLFMGLCIQEVAALSTLLGSQFDGQKVKVIDTVVEVGREVMDFSRQRDKTSQQQHAARLMKLARRQTDQGIQNPPLTDEVRLRMLEELLQLQETALTLIEAAVSSACKSQPSVIQANAGVINELIEELKRVVYTRRRQVFKSKHLSHYLRCFEGSVNRGVLMGMRDINNLDAKPEQTFKQKLADLTDGEAWVKMTLEETQSILLEAVPQKGRYSAKLHEPPAVQSSASQGVQVSESRLGRSDRIYRVPPRFQRMSSFSGDMIWMTGTQKSLIRAGTSHRDTQQTQGGLRPSFDAQMPQSSSGLYRQTPATASPLNQQLSELRTELPQVLVGPESSVGPFPSSGPACQTTHAARSQSGAPAVVDTLEAPSRGREAGMHFSVSKEKSWSPWSSAWPSRLPASPRPPTPYLTSPTATYEAGGREARSHQTGGIASGPQLRLMPPVGFLPTSVFLTPQSIASAAARLLESLHSQAPPAAMPGMAMRHPRPTLYAPSPSIPPSLTTVQTFQSIGISSSSEPGSRQEGLHSVDQGMPGGEQWRQGVPGLALTMPTLPELLAQEAGEQAREALSWIDSESDSG